MVGPATPPPVPIASLRTPDPARNDTRDITGSIGIADKGDGAPLSTSRSMSEPGASPVLLATTSPTDPCRRLARRP